MTDWDPTIADPLTVTEDDWDPRRREPGVSIVWLFAILVVLVAAIFIGAPRRASEIPPSPALPETSRRLEVTPSPVPVVAAARVPRPTDREPNLPSASVPERALLPATSTVVSGRASWYCGAGSRCTRGVPAGAMAAAAGPALRVGDWRGRIVRVESGGRAVLVRLVDWCACPTRVIDLYRSAFSRLASPSRGLIIVSITWSAKGSSSRVTATLPPTDTP